MKSIVEVHKTLTALYRLDELCVIAEEQAVVVIGLILINLLALAQAVDSCVWLCATKWRGRWKSSGIASGMA